jgi:hypothetical protein
MFDINAMRDFYKEITDGNAHFISINRLTPDGEIVETIPYALIPLNLMSEKEIDRVMRIRQMNYPDKKT